MQKKIKVLMWLLSLSIFIITGCSDPKDPSEPSDPLEPSVKKTIKNITSKSI